MTSKIESLKSDAAELYRLAELSERRRVKDILSIEAKKLETEISLLQEKEKPAVPGPIAVSTSTRKAYDVKVTTYAWDQSNTSVKIFVTLPKVETLSADNITCSFTNTSFDLYVKELEGKNYVLSLKNLFQNIVAEKSTWKVKSGMVIINLSKNISAEWTSLTKAKETQFPKPPKMDDEDPSAGLMNLMKQLYNDGDDEMKRTIAKVWTEGREKTGQGMAF